MSTEALEWMDIETAPKDGTEILIICDEGVKLGSWLAGAHPWDTGDWWIEGGQITASNPTYWMPLREAPNAQRVGDRRCAALSRSVQRSKGARSTEGLCLAGSNEERRST